MEFRSSKKRTWDAMLRPSVRLSTDGCEALSAKIFPKNYEFSEFQNFPKSLVFHFCRTFRKFAAEPNFSKFDQFLIWILQSKALQCEESESELRISMRNDICMEMSISEFRPPWRCNFRFSLWDLFCPKPGHRTSRKLHVTKKVSQLDISFTYPYPKWTVPA